MDGPNTGIVSGNTRVHRGSLQSRFFHVSLDVSSFYITNFLESVQVSDMWRVCACLGKVMDMFISKKLSCMGKYFGFIRFSSVCNMDHMIKQLCYVSYGFHKLFACSP